MSPPRVPVRRLFAFVVLAALGACGSYRVEMRDYRDVFERYEDGALEVSLEGEWSEVRGGGMVPGNPYHLLVRYVDAGGGVREAELRSFKVRAQSGGRTALSLSAPVTEPLRPIPPRGQFGFGPGGEDAMAVPPNRYAAFLFSGVDLGYQPYEVSGVLVLRGDGAPREVRFQGVLVPEPRTERRNRFRDRFSGV